MHKFIGLNELELDLITELFNLGVGNAAASLSLMVKQEITLSVPKIEFLSIDELTDELGYDNPVCSVSQSVSGPFNAKSILFFHEKNSLEIILKLLGAELPEDTLLEIQKEAFSEIGNIVLNACIGSLANALNQEFIVDLPIYELARADDLLSSDELRQDTVLFIHIDLTLSESNITGYMAFLMGAISLQQLKELLKTMLAKL